jgi:hypothetical protein
MSKVYERGAGMPASGIRSHGDSVIRRFSVDHGQRQTADSNGIYLFLRFLELIKLSFF